MFRAESHPADLGIDVAKMATSLANSKIFFRALTDLSEKFDTYRTPFHYIPAFELSPDQIKIVDRSSYQNFATLLMDRIHWDNSRVVTGWDEYTTAEKVEHFGSLFRLLLSDISFHLLSDRWDMKCHGLRSKAGANNRGVRGSKPVGLTVLSEGP